MRERLQRVGYVLFLAGVFVAAFALSVGGK